MTREEHLLVILIEECAEVSKEVSKALRFGMKDHAPGETMKNDEKISIEIGDLVAAMEMLYEAGVIREPKSGDIEKKKVKVEKYLNYSKSVGKLAL